ncbi:MAG: glutamate synthase-related protein [Anaerolineae bacterium]|nr:glutamate synthase-related protein [Anaerolineae bacterium]
MQASTDQQAGLRSTHERERDACALIANVRKEGRASHGNVKRTIESLTKMGHRTGIVDGEGDGAGILTDIPRQLWSKILAQAGLRGSLAAERRFWVGHVFIPRSEVDVEGVKHAIARELTGQGFDVLFDRDAPVNVHALGPMGQQEAPLFWQVAGMAGADMALDAIDSNLFAAQMRLERATGAHFASLSAHTVVYKMRGAVEVLPRYFPELRHPDYCSAISLGHARYSTNTRSAFERVQPFALLGHNGEFNTINRLRDEAKMLGIQLVEGASDSQDVDRLLHALCLLYGLDLAEAMEVVFPPIPDELQYVMPEVQAVYRHYRAAFGPFAQGPAAVAARLGDLCVFSVDALGLRPLWFGETEKEYFFTSERGVIPLDTMVGSPKPLAPGEKMAVRVERGQHVYVHEYPAIRRHVVDRARERGWRLNSGGGDISGAEAWPVGGSGYARPWPGLRLPDASRLHPERDPAGATVEVADAPKAAPLPEPLALRWAVADAAEPTARSIDVTVLAALGWDREDVAFVEHMAETGKEPHGSLGYDGPLAVLADKRVNLADFFKETVSVVTNPSIDREREQEHFSTQAVIGARPDLCAGEILEGQLIILESPILPGGHPDLGALDAMREAAAAMGSMTIDDLLAAFGPKATRLAASAQAGESLPDALARLADAAVAAAREGAQCVLLDDEEAVQGEGVWLDPHLAVAAVARALREALADFNLRRRTGIVLRSGALRNLHDVALACGFGADAVNPYAMFAVAAGLTSSKAAGQSANGDGDAAGGDTLTPQINMMKALTTGLERVTSTIGCHELRGYGRVVSSIGLAEPVAALFDTDNFCTDPRGWARLEADAAERTKILRGEARGKLAHTPRMYPRLYKLGGKAAQGEVGVEAWMAQVEELEAKGPVALRHLIGFKALPEGERLDPRLVDTTIGGYSMPALIPAMSFGSQGETAFRAYAEAAYRLNIICINGEGGELLDIMGRYKRNRGQQVASARFGVNAEFLNSADFIEIKIGQGAKPGEGGQLPGFKVTEQIARTRHTPSGITLISPSNNHDVYSIEDLAQIIEELKTINPHAKVSVKVPVVPGIGIIAVGVAKAGADIINLTGFEGGTGSARAHSLQHVGLPAEIGVVMAHHALVESGIRDRVELWTDGGMKSGADIVRMVCLGANRIGFGTLAMVAVGCTICRSCQSGTCHVGITSHLKTAEEALKYGQKHFEPRDFNLAVEGIVRLFNVLREEVAVRTAALGFARTRDLVGRADLLEQTAGQDLVNLTPMLTPAPPHARRRYEPGVGRRLNRPRNSLTRLVAETILDAVEKGEQEITYDDEHVVAHDRAMGTYLTGALTRRRVEAKAGWVQAVHLLFSNSALPGNGLAAFNNAPVEVVVEGGAQDGVAKSARGGKVLILKGMNHDGVHIDGSVGKSFAYGAQGGLLIVQGNADSRACIRLSGADVVFGGEITAPIQDELGCLGARANLKGLACEYMTSGRVLVLGDPGPWFCSGMTGGVVYQRLQPELGFDEAALRRRLAKGAQVALQPVAESDLEAMRYLLGQYQEALLGSHQTDAAARLEPLLANPAAHFVKIAPVSS